MQENNQNFNHLKIHTQYSICEGAIKIHDLKNYCKENKIKSIGLSDTSNLCGALEFSEEVSKAGTQPIIGTQINFKFNNEIGVLPLIAKNHKGYETILRLSSNSYLQNKDTLFPCCDLQELINKPEGIIVLSGSLNSLSGNLFLKNKLQDLNELYHLLKKNLKSDFYLEIQRHNDLSEKQFEQFNLNLSSKLKIPIIATHEVYYIDPITSPAPNANKNQTNTYIIVARLPIIPCAIKIVGIQVPTDANKKVNAGPAPNPNSINANVMGISSPSHTYIGIPKINANA